MDAEQERAGGCEIVAVCALAALGVRGAIVNWEIWAYVRHPVEGAPVGLGIGFISAPTALVGMTLVLFASIRQGSPVWLRVLAGLVGLVALGAVGLVISEVGW